MQNAEYAARVDATKRRAHGRRQAIEGGIDFLQRFQRQQPFFRRGRHLGRQAGQRLQIRVFQHLPAVAVRHQAPRDGGPGG